MTDQKRAVVLLSGGLDSTTVLAIAKSEGYMVFALSFDYGQNHKAELSAATTIASKAEVEQHVVLKIDLRAFGGSALTAEMTVPKDRSEQDMSTGVPITYVPARNTVFLSLGLAWAEALGAEHIFIGVNALDYSGYPDCRPEYIEAFQNLANLATKAGTESGVNFTIHTPLIAMTKKQIIEAGLALGVDYALTSTCYDPDDSGQGCGHCDACALRLKGFAEAGLSDPALYQEGVNTPVSYAVKEMFYTLQGEGVNTGRAAVFCRFAGCNLWTGREADRTEAVCQFCDTDFVGVDGDGGGRFVDAAALAQAISEKWPQNVRGKRFVVCTGGEPLLQVDSFLTDALHEHGFTVAIETNGTLPVPAGVDWVCVSPKAGSTLVTTVGDELKVVYPQETDPRVYEDLAFQHFFIQAKDGPHAALHLSQAVQFCSENPLWRLSLQTHKIIGIR